MFYKEFSENQLNFLTNFFDLYGKLKSWSDLVKDYNLNHKLFFKKCQLIRTLPKPWKKLITNDKRNYCKTVILNHTLLRDNHIYSIEKLNAKEHYYLSICFKKVLLSSEKYFENIFPDNSVKWRDVYILPQLVTKNSFLHMFRNKILNNVLYLNKKLSRFELVTSKLCSFCNQVDEIVIHIFTECSATITVWKKLIHYFRNTLHLPEISPQSTMFDFLLADKETFQIESLILLLFKIYLYESLISKAMIFDSFLRKIKKAYVMEKK